MGQKKKVSDISTYELNDEGSNNYYEDFDFSDGEGSTGSHGLNDGDDDDLYTDEAKAAEKRRSDRAKLRAQKKAANDAPSHGGGLEALMAQAPTRNNSIGILGDRVPVQRTRPAPPLRSRSGGVLKLNRKISRAVTDSTRHIVGAATTVATSVARGREEERDGECVRSSSLGALTRKLTSRAERKAAKEAEGGMNNLSLEDANSRSPKQGRMRESSLGALSRRARRQRWKSVDDAEDLELTDGEEGDMDLNQQSPMNSPVRQRKSAGVITTNKARRERWKSVDDTEDLLNGEGEFELKMDDERTPSKKEKKRANSIGAISTKARRERQKSTDSDDVELSPKGSKKDHSKDEDGEKKTKKKIKKKSSGSDDELSDDDGGKKTKRKVKRSASKASSASDDDSSSDDDSAAEKKTKVKRKVKRSTSRDLSDDSSDEGTVRSRRRKASSDKPRKKKQSKSPKPPKKKASKKVTSDDEQLGGLDLGGGLGGGQTRGRRVGRRSSLGNSETMKTQDEANAILRRTQQANQKWDASKEETSAIERRVRRRASIGAGESARGSR